MTVQRSDGSGLCGDRSRQKLDGNMAAVWAMYTSCQRVLCEGCALFSVLESEWQGVCMYERVDPEYAVYRPRIGLCQCRRLLSAIHSSVYTEGKTCLTFCHIAVSGSHTPKASYWE